MQWVSYSCYNLLRHAFVINRRCSWKQSLNDSASHSKQIIIFREDLHSNFLIYLDAYMDAMKESKQSFSSYSSKGFNKQELHIWTTLSIFHWKFSRKISCLSLRSFNCLKLLKCLLLLLPLYTLCSLLQVKDEDHFMFIHIFMWLDWGINGSLVNVWHLLRSFHSVLSSQSMFIRAFQLCHNNYGLLNYFITQLEDD